MHVNYRPMLHRARYCYGNRLSDRPSVRL